MNVLNIPGDAFPLILTGSTENDIFHASVLDDDIEAKSGNDTIKGGKGNDLLNGGLDFDTYIINPGDGVDTIIDEDGLGVIQFNNINVSGRGNVADGNNWIKIDDIWVDKENNFYYQLLLQSDGSNDLVVTLVTRGDGIAQARIKVWQDGQLGITLGENTSPDTPVYDRAILGDLQPDDVDAETDGVQIGYDELGNVIVGAEEEPNRIDQLYGSAGNNCQFSPL